MKIIRCTVILFFLTNIFFVDAIASFEPFVYEDNPSELSENFQNAFQAVESEDVTDFISQKKDREVVGALDTGFEVEKMVKIKAVSNDFQSVGPEVEDRVLTDVQKHSQKIFEERLKEDRRKQKILMALQEQEYLEMRQKVWKAFEEKVDRAGQKRDFSPVKQQKAIHAQSLLEQLQASKRALLEKDKLASDLADKLSKINAQRIIAAQLLQIQKITRLNLSGATNIKSKDKRAQLMQERNQEQINTESFLLLDKQFNIVNSQLQNVRNEAQKVRRQFQEIQQTIEQQLPQSSGTEDVY